MAVPYGFIELSKGKNLKSDYDSKKKRKKMSFTARITISFLAVIIVPAILIAVTLMQPMSSRLKYYGENYGVQNLSYSGMYNNSQFIANLTNETFSKFISETKEDYSLASDEEYLESINEELSANEACLVVMTSDEHIVYNGSDADDGQIKEILSTYTGIDGASNEWLTIRSDIQSMVRSTEITFSDGEYGRAFIITNMNQIWPGMRRWLSDLALASLFILGITSVIMGAWLYVSTVNPLMKLKKAAQNVRDGNLDFQVEGSSIEEVNEVCEDFEEMRKRLKESAEEKLAADKGNKELISNISHDLKTPITAIRGYCEGIMDGVACTPEKMDKYIRTIYNKANEMNNLINELTIYSKIDTNRIPYTFTKINIVRFFEDCIDELTLELESRNVKLTYENTVTDENTLIIGDVEQLNRVIHNIINNSLKYMDKQEKSIIIRLLDKDDFLQMEFEDNGKGIEKNAVPFIFERFYRTDASRNSTQGGSGIGLSIVKKILEDHGGKVWATSVEGEGTTIHFVIRKYREIKLNEQDTDN